MLMTRPNTSYVRSPSSRRAWIEIWHPLSCKNRQMVALLAEGVDRNRYTLMAEALQSVALLAEGVDRNSHGVSGGRRRWPSPSSRRAWIEILLAVTPNGKDRVALLAEGVDRNYTLRGN